MKSKIHKNSPGTIFLLTIFFSFCLISCEKSNEPDFPEPGTEEPQGENEVIRILTIGNSFSEDAVEHYLFGLAEAEGIPMEIGNLYLGGASLNNHWTNAQNDLASYDYRKIDTLGNKTATPGTSIATALDDEEWDYISFQQVSSNSGQFSTFEITLPLLLDYVKEKATHPEVQYVLHQTWAYAKDSDHFAFENYDHDQELMYNAITEAYEKAFVTYEFDLLVPSGTAIQNGRTSLVGDNFTRDGYHLDIHIGRYTAASTWFEAITGSPVTGNPYKPEALTDLQAEIAQRAAHYAVLEPNQITVLEDYRQVEAGILGDTLYRSLPLYGMDLK